jgi:hypothetical protein
MADPRTETELDAEPETGGPDPTPAEAARLRESIRRAREDLAAGRVYRTSEEGLRAFLRLAEAFRDGAPAPEDGTALAPLDEAAATRRAIQIGLERGWIEPA